MDIVNDSVRDVHFFIEEHDGNIFATLCRLASIRACLHIRVQKRDKGRGQFCAAGVSQLCARICEIACDMFGSLLQRVFRQS